MRCSIVFILLAITFGRSLSQHCEVDESQHECGGYCYGAVKPVLDYLAILQKRVESCEAKQPADTLSKIALMNEKLDTLAGHMATQQYLEKRSTAKTHELEQQVAAVRQELDTKSTGLQELGNSSKILEQKVAAVRQEMGEKIETLGKQMAIQQELESKSGEHVHKLELQLDAVRKERDEKLDTLQAMEKSLQEKVKKLEQKLRQERDERSTGLQDLGNSSQAKIHILEQQVAAVRKEMGEKIETLGKQMAIQQELESKSGENVHKLELQLDAVRKERDEKLDTLQAMEKSLQEKVKKLELKLKPKNFELFKKIGSKYYYIENTKGWSWQGALDICQEMGAHLVSLQNEDELKALDSMLDQNKWYWIDLKKLEAKGEFISATTGVKGTFFHWGEIIGKNYDCVFLYRGEMRTYLCGVSDYFICEAYWVDHMTI
ncbi:intracellular protein transport protein USO1-like [Drosophila obscura]|uniref:intracellular protein transport protein USO1-like n=1 Tax=Drosophila obscura TaxID=7282 RepID=UPI001BB230AC|nr:intracellular protein transport protein USO1-like [Drosophila obscura]